jgi:ATP-binding protein involved in chromosome partitioning
MARGATRFAGVRRARVRVGGLAEFGARPYDGFRHGFCQNEVQPAHMTTITEEGVLDALSHVQEPELGRDIVSLEMVKSIAIDGDRVAFTIELTTPACPLKDEIETNARTALQGLGAETVDITWGAMVRRASPRQAEQLVPGVKNIVAVASGKGGVGKSTVSVNLAVALAQAGASVGLLDADITGPNIPQMLGVEGQPVASANNKITPLERYGVKTISIQFFVPEGQPIVWRGPLVGGAIQQFLRDVEWGDLDYLVIDLPPGTSDAQLTLAQAVPISGAVLVTTPQEVSLSDVGKALAMFQRMSVPILGLVENMTAFACPHCGELTEIFGRGGGERFAAQHSLEYLGGVPLDITVRQGGDVGVPAVAQREPGPAAKALTAVAQAVAARMSVRAAAGDGRPLLTIS